MPLTDHQTKELSGLIDRRRNALLAELREDAERARDQPYAEHAGQAPDTGDESVATLIACPNTRSAQCRNVSDAF